MKMLSRYKLLPVILTLILSITLLGACGDKEEEEAEP